MPEYLAVRDTDGAVYPIVASALNPDIHEEIEDATVVRDGTGRLVVQSVPTPPAKSDSKAAWVDYAETQGADPEQAEESTKADLIADYGKEN